MMQVESDYSESLLEDDETTDESQEREEEDVEEVNQNTQKQPLTVEEATKVNDEKDRLLFRPFIHDGQTYFIGIGSVFEIKPKFCKEGSYKVFINEKYYLQDTTRNECWNSMSGFVTAWRERLGLRKGGTTYDGWKHVNLVLSNNLKIENHYLYRIVKTNVRTEQKRKSASKTSSKAKKAKTTSPTSSEETPKLSAREVEKLKHKIFSVTPEMPCPCCGKVTVTQSNSELCHIIARKNKGSNDRYNLVVACKNCNRGKYVSNTECLFLIMFKRKERGILTKILNLLKISQELKSRDDATAGKLTIPDYAKKYFGRKVPGGIKYKLFFDSLQTFTSAYAKVDKTRKEIEKVNEKIEENRNELHALIGKQGVENNDLYEIDCGRDESELENYESD